MVVRRTGRPGSVKCATWNVARLVPSATRRSMLITDQIKHVAADVWVLTETDDSCAPGSGFQSAATSGADRPGEASERWTMIWSRYPLEPLAPTSDPIRAVAARIVPPNGAPLIVYGTVLPWLGSPWCGVAAEQGKAFAAALAAQELDWQRLREAHPGHDMIVAGDFNQDLADTHYYGSRKNRRRLQLALDRAGLVALTAEGNDPVRQNSPPCACIDHICVSTPLRLRAGSPFRWPDLPKPDRRLSDHFGIGVEFGLANIHLHPTPADESMSRRG